MLLMHITIHVYRILCTRMLYFLMNIPCIIDIDKLFTCSLHSLYSSLTKIAEFRQLELIKKIINFLNFGFL